MAQRCVWLTNLYPADCSAGGFRTLSNCLSSWDAVWVNVLTLCAFRQSDTDELRFIFNAAPCQPFTKFRSTPHRVLTTLGSDPQPEPALEAHFNQLARIDEGLWAWHFVLRDAQGEGIASVNRVFRGFGREVRWRLRCSLN